MTGRSWTEIVNTTVKRLDLAALLGMAVEYHGEHAKLLATMIRELARLADREARGRSVRLLGWKFTVSRDG